MDVYLGLGSNLGDRKGNILAAVGHLDEFFGAKHAALSSLMETEPWGFECEDKFVNAVVKYSVAVPDGTCMSAFCHSVLDACKGIEAKMGRTGGPEYDGYGKRIYRSRIIDIDILTVGDFRIKDETLEIPHPLMEERDFVMKPLSEIR